MWQKKTGLTEDGLKKIEQDLENLKTGSAKRDRRKNKSSFVFWRSVREQ